jgi:hypothetical protein
MSHFSKIATKLVDKRLLLQALSELNIPYEEGKVLIRGYQKGTTPCEIKIPTDSDGYDIGFLNNGDNFEMIADWDGLDDFDQEGFLNALTQRYAYCAVKDQFGADFSVVEEKQESDNSIRILLRKMG